MKGIIYKYTFPDGKVYIGQTRRYPEQRRREHLDAVAGPTNVGFWEAYKKYGEPKYEELYSIELDDLDTLVEVLNYLETRFIRMYKADYPEFGYNRTSDGNVSTGRRSILRRKYSELFNKLSSQRLQNYNSAFEKIMHTKQPLTDEEKYLVREKYREENGFQSYIDNYNLETLPNFENENVEFFVSKALDFVQFMITQEIEEEVSQFIRENSEQIIEEERSKKIVVQLDDKGNVVREFGSFTEICQAFNVPRADNVKNVLKADRKVHMGIIGNTRKT